jgi:hypothetical protein
MQKTDVTNKKFLSTLWNDWNMKCLKKMFPYIQALVLDDHEGHYLSDFTGGLSYFTWHVF